MKVIENTGKLLGLILSSILLCSFLNKEDAKIKLVDLDKFYDSINTKGCMVIYDTKHNTYYLYAHMFISLFEMKMMSFL